MRGFNAIIIQPQYRIKPDDFTGQYCFKVLPAGASFDTGATAGQQSQLK